MSLLGKITKGKVNKPPRIIVAGQSGVGKSTFAAEFPSSLIIDAEKRTEHLDVARLEVESWKDVLGIMSDIYNLAKDGKCEYKTMVFDTIDHIELLIHRQLCEADGVDSIDAVGGGYGRGYLKALHQWQRFTHGLEALRNVGITCLLIAHTHVKTFKNPTGEDYDRWALKMNSKAADFLRERADAVGFAQFRDFATKKNPKDGMTKAKAVTSGERILSFGHSPAYESKPGLNLPDELPLSYEALKQALDAA